MLIFLLSIDWFVVVVVIVVVVVVFAALSNRLDLKLDSAFLLWNKVSLHWDKMTEVCKHSVSSTPLSFVVFLVKKQLSLCKLNYQEKHKTITIFKHLFR